MIDIEREIREYIEGYFDFDFDDLVECSLYLSDKYNGFDFNS